MVVAMTRSKDYIHRDLNSSKMTAWVYTGYGPFGSVQKLETDYSVPEISDDQVLLKVEAAALNPDHYKRMLGYFKDIDSALLCL